MKWLVEVSRCESVGEAYPLGAVLEVEDCAVVCVWSPPVTARGMWLPNRPKARDSREVSR